MKKNQTKYANEFKKQIVMLYNNGKSASDICNDYSICRPSLSSLGIELDSIVSFKKNCVYSLIFIN